MFHIFTVSRLQNFKSKSEPDLVNRVGYVMYDEYIYI